jgi:L-galactose dehydrogenase
MNYRPLGANVPPVSTLGFGASPLGNVYGTASADDVQRAVNTALDLGINFFDTSPYYGLTLSEERLGRALQGARSRVVLATKCGRMGADRV